MRRRHRGHRGGRALTRSRRAGNGQRAGAWLPPVLLLLDGRRTRWLAWRRMRGVERVHGPRLSPHTI